MVQFNTQYDPTSYNPIDPRYTNPVVPTDMEDTRIEEPLDPVVDVSEIGQSVPEGQRFGTFIQSATGAIHAGAGKIELATSMGGGQENVGAEAYGKDSRAALREMSKSSGTEFVSIHSPVQIGNMSGLTQQGHFSDEQRKMAVDEVKKAVDMATDVGGGAVVTHTGEFQRRMSEADWSKNGEDGPKFLSYLEEPGRAQTFLVDDRDGKIVQDIRKSMIIVEPEFHTRKTMSEQAAGEEKAVTFGMRPDGTPLKDWDWVDENGNFLDPADNDQMIKRVPIEEDPNKPGIFKTKTLTWNDIEERQEQYNEDHPKEPITTEEMAFRIQMTTRILQQRGVSVYYAQYYKRHKEELEKLREAYDYWEKHEKETPEKDKWRLKKSFSDQYPGLVPPDVKFPSEYLKDRIEENERNILHVHEASAAADASAQEFEETLKHVEPIDKYAKDQSLNSYAEAGIYAMRQTDDAMKRKDKSERPKRDVFVAPENLWPEMGYGTHPDELMELIEESREKMVVMLTQKKIPSPHREMEWVDEKRGGKTVKTLKLKEVENPWYDERFARDKNLARKEAEDHIKATLDTQHLGMWRKHFQPKWDPAKKRLETAEETDKRFNKWFMNQVEEMEKKNVIGHVHLVDGMMGGGHTHLPAGQGEFPVVEAIEYLKKKGYGGTIVSEGHGEEQMGAGRILTETWKAFRSPIGYGSMYAKPGGFSQEMWPNVHHGYFGRTYPPMFIFGAYSPSNEWQLWSEVQME